MEEFGVSVRTLVEFTHRGEDIISGLPLKSMQDGVLGHKARQAILETDWETEKSLSLSLPLEDEEKTLVLRGRMDAFLEGDCPVIEEIKLWQTSDPPDSPNPAHLAQAQVYGHMLMEERPGLSEVCIRVCYVRSSGETVRMFPLDMNREELREVFQNLYLPYLRHLRLLWRHIRARNASLENLSFPFSPWRPGQRDMSVQVFTAIRQKKRLFASMPTGCGKTLAVLFPALKALARGLTGQLFYLTARTTQQQAPMDALQLLSSPSLCLFSLILIAREKVCPEGGVCSPDFCTRARGHFLRDQEALLDMLSLDVWRESDIRLVCERYHLCPFEFRLRLSEFSDLVICDYNYALDPRVRLVRIFETRRNLTLLFDEAHHLHERLRDMLSGTADGAFLTQMRREVRRCRGQKHPLYKALGKVIRLLKELRDEKTGEETVLPDRPEDLLFPLKDLLDILGEFMGTFPWESPQRVLQTLKDLYGLRRALEEDHDCAFLLSGRQVPLLRARCLSGAAYFERMTRRLSGTICFSATFHPLPIQKMLLGGSEEDACFEAPSPFDPSRLLVLIRRVNTRYAERGRTAGAVAEAILSLVSSHPGKYLVFFPGFAYLNQVLPLLNIPCQVQKSGMKEEERQFFLEPYRTGTDPVLSLCVLGGLFSEGIDLPGNCLDGVCIVGLGLPTVSPEQTCLQQYMEKQHGQGFLLASLLPGMQKVAQAGGRVIRREEDRGVILLLDDRYPGCLNLLPPHWQVREDTNLSSLRAFWETPPETGP